MSRPPANSAAGVREAALAAVLLLAGCAGPDAPSAPTPPRPPAAAPAMQVALRFRVGDERRYRSVTRGKAVPEDPRMSAMEFAWSWGWMPAPTGPSRGCGWSATPDPGRRAGAGEKPAGPRFALDLDTTFERVAE